MSTEPKDVAVAFLSLGSQGKMEEAIALLAEEVEFWYTGVKDVTRDDLVAGMRGMAEVIVPGGGIEIVDILEEDGRVAIEYRGRIPLATGKVYANTYHTKMVVRNGKITVMREYLDPLIVMDAFGGMSSANPE